jgi:uncharacterized protein (DUF1778 family)
MARESRRGFFEDRAPRSGFGKTAASSDAKSGRIELRTSSATKMLLQRAAAATGKTVTDFVLEAGLGAAEKTLLDRQLFRLDDAAWREFLRVLDRPVSRKPRLKKLLAGKSVLE